MEVGDFFSQLGAMVPSFKSCNYSVKFCISCFFLMARQYFLKL